MTDDTSKMLAEELADIVSHTQEPAPAVPAYVDSEDDSVVSGAWAIQDTGSVDWALGRVAALKAEAEQIDAAAFNAKKRIDDRRNTLVARLQRGIDFFGGHISTYCTANKAAVLGGGKAKSRSFLNGLVGWRKKGAKLVVTDEAALKGWLIKQPDVSLYRVKVEPEMAALQANFKANGVIPPGMEYQPEAETFYTDPVDLTANPTFVVTMRNK
jgi:phage host-nuclease inhibitor protein Gam